MPFDYYLGNLPPELRDALSWAIGSASLVLSGRINGLQLSWKANNEVYINAGSCRDSNNTANIDVVAQLTVNITMSGAGGLDIGSKTAGGYDTYVIDGPTVSPAGLFVLINTTPIMPANYTLKRRLGAIYNSASSITDFDQAGSGRSREIFFHKNGMVILGNGAATGWTEEDAGHITPATCRRIQWQATQKSAGVAARFRRSGWSGVTSGQFSILPPPAGDMGRLTFYLNTIDQTIEYRNMTGGGSVDLNMVSYIDEL